jgi:hypothetical protein
MRTTLTTATKIKLLGLRVLVSFVRIVMMS